MFLQSKKFFIFLVFGLLAIVLVTYILVASLKKSTKNEASLPQIKVGYNVQSVNNSPLIIAYKNGYFNNQKIDVQLISLAGGQEVAMAIGSGQIDMGIVSPLRLYNPIERGVPIKILSPMGQIQSDLLVRPNSDIASLKDLEGKNVSCGPGGGNKEVTLRYVLKNEGVNVKNVNFINIDKAYLPVALMEKKIVDAVLIDEGVGIEKYKKIGAVILSDWQEKKYYELSVGSVLMTNFNFLEDNEQNVYKFYKAIIEANRFIKSYSAKAAIIISEHINERTAGALNIEPDEFKKTINEGKSTFFLWADPTPVVEMARISYELGQVGRILSLDDLYDFRFKDLLESAQNEIYGPAKN